MEEKKSLKKKDDENADDQPQPSTSTKSPSRKNVRTKKKKGTSSKKKRSPLTKFTVAKIGTLLRSVSRKKDGKQTMNPTSFPDCSSVFTTSAVPKNEGESALPPKTSTCSTIPPSLQKRNEEDWYFESHDDTPKKKRKIENLMEKVLPKNKEEIDEEQASFEEISSEKCTEISYLERSTFCDDMPSVSSSPMPETSPFHLSGLGGSQPLLSETGANSPDIEPDVSRPNIVENVETVPPLSSDADSRRRIRYDSLGSTNEDVSALQISGTPELLEPSNTGNNEEEAAENPSDGLEPGDSADKL